MKIILNKYNNYDIKHSCYYFEMLEKKMKEYKLSGYITMLVSLIISIVSGYCTVVGMGKVFASAVYVTMFIATVIEMGRVVLIYDLHHYWDKMKFHQKVPGVLMLLIAIILSAMGIFGFMSNAHTQRTQEVVPIELEIKQKQSEIKVLNTLKNIRRWNEDSVRSAWRSRMSPPQWRS